MVQSHSFGVEWWHVAADGGVGAMILDTQGRVLFINSVAAAVYVRRPAREAIGLRLGDLLPQAAGLERIELARRVIGDGEPMIAHDLWSGWALRWTVRRVANAAEAENPAAIIIMCHEGALPEDGSDAAPGEVEFRHVDLGPLAALTASELKVMALIGEGMSNAEIAAKLHRAVKTVESHRAALTEKTGATSRVQLGIMARRAALMRRVSLDNPNPAAPRVAV